MKPPAGVIGVEGLEIQRVAVVEAASGEFRQVARPPCMCMNMTGHPIPGSSLL